MIATAAMIAAVSFAVLALALVLLVVRLTTFLHDARHVIGSSARANEAREQLERTEVVTASMGPPLPGDCGCVHERARTQPQSPKRELGGKAAAFVYGVRYAVGKRRGAAPVAVPGSVDNSKELAR